MSKKITLSDIAKEAGVSTATVSYVLNYSDKEKISHNTRFKVFEAARKLKYSPNLGSKSNINKKIFLVGVVINSFDNLSLSLKNFYFSLIEELQKELSKFSYDIVILSKNNYSENTEFDNKHILKAIFLIDCKDNLIPEITNKFFVPVIFIDTFSTDPLFSKVIGNYSQALELIERNYFNPEYLIIPNFSNNYILELVKEKFKNIDIFLDIRKNSLPIFLEDKKFKKGIILGEILGLQCERFLDNKNFCVITENENSVLLPNTKKIIISSKEKARRSVEFMFKILDLKNNNISSNTKKIKPT